MDFIAEYQKRFGQFGGNHKDPASPLTILLVDERNENFDAIQNVRQEVGILIECVWITSALKALINLKTIQPVVLIADLSMPNVDGYELLRTVRSSHLADALAGTYGIGSKTGLCAVAAWLLCVSDGLA